MMDNVWLHTKKSILWDPIINEFQKKGVWEKVIRRTKRPSLEEIKKLKKEITLPREDSERYDLSYEKLLKQQFSILDMFLRKTDWGSDRYNSASIHELSSRIRIYYEFYTLSLTKENISLVIFYNTPHMGWDTILYEAAKNLKIKTLILDQSNFSNKFFHSFVLHDFGTFKTSRILDHTQHYQIEKKFEKDWFYMKKNRWKKEPLSLKKLITLSKYKKRINHFIEGNDYLRLIREIASKNRRSQSFFRFYTEINYKKELKKITTTQYSIKKKYVYFPLHFQPEKVSSVWTGIYIDQVLAIERLSNIIPSDWFIYVKENPKQRGAYRSNLFFERLKLIPNLLFLSRKANTFELTRNSQFVATIVGSVGWEAITGGKNVLLFGWGAWYKNLPGVYKYRQDLDVNELLTQKIDHKLLEKNVAKIYNKCGTGIIFDAYIPSITDFSIEKNTITVFDSIKRILY